MITKNGCFVYGRESHRANEKQDQKIVNAEIQKLKEKGQTFMLSEDDLSYVASLFEEDQSEKDDKAHFGDQNGNYSEKEDDDHLDNEGSIIARMSDRDGKSAQLSPANSSFVHGRAICDTKDKSIRAMYSHLVRDSRDKFVRRY